MLTEQSRLHARLFFGLANAILDHPQAAEDACQIALMKAWEQRMRFTNPAVLRGWISKVVVNESLAIARQRRSEGKGFLLGLLPKFRSALTDGLADERRPLDEAEFREAVLAALERLPDETTRLIVVLRDMYEETGVAVAELLGSSESQVSKHLREGRRHLRELMVGFLRSVAPDA